MRKLILISALLLASASAQAGDRSLSLGSAGGRVVDTSAVATVTPEAPKPIAQVSVRLAQAATTASDAAPIQAPAPLPAQAPAPVETQAPAATPTTTATTTTETKPATTTESKKTVKKARHESNEHKARRIAARYGVYW